MDLGLINSWGKRGNLDHSLPTIIEFVQRGKPGSVCFF